MRPVLNHELAHATFFLLFDATVSMAWDNLPSPELTPPELRDAGVYGWGLKGMYWPPELTA